VAVPVVLAPTRAASDDVAVCLSDHTLALCRSVAALRRVFSFVTMSRSASWRACAAACWRSMRNRGIRSTDISWLMIPFVSIPDARPPI
jgi:hypothetical protein